MQNSSSSSQWSFCWDKTRAKLAQSAFTYQNSYFLPNVLLGEQLFLGMVTYWIIYLYKHLLTEFSAKNDVSLAAMLLCTMKTMIFEQAEAVRILSRRTGETWNFWGTWISFQPLHLQDSAPVTGKPSKVG